jgi:hypothetical protein
MGNIEYTKWYVSMYYTEFGIMEEKIRSINEIPKNIDKYVHIRVKKEVDKTEYKIIKESNSIEERLHENDYIKINDEELYVLRVVQCDNGDVICYTTKTIQDIEDTNSRDNAYIIKKEIEKRKLEYILRQKPQNKIQEIMSKKKWYQFWK